MLRLHKAERLAESFMQIPLSWVHPGFSAYAGPPVHAAAIASLESQARYITRPALAMDALRELDDGRLAMETPPDPRTGATSIELDPLEWIHRITSHLPDPGNIVKGFTGRIPTAAEFASILQMEIAPPCRRRASRRRTIRIVPGKPAARGLA